MIASSASRRRSTSPSVWRADIATRKRDVPAGTVGGRIAGTSSPRSSSSAAAARARASSPSRIGMIGDE